MVLKQTPIINCIVVVFLMVYVVPRFSHLYADIGSDLPLMSQLLMRWGLLLESHGAAILAGVLLLAGGAVYAASRPASKQWLLRTLWRLPFDLASGGLGEREELAHFGGETLTKCFNCGNCTAVCALSEGDTVFPRKIIRSDTPVSVLVFSLVMGALWLATVPLTSGLVAYIYGIRYMGTLYGIVFFSHQVGGFLGVGSLCLAGDQCLRL